MGWWVMPVYDSGGKAPLLFGRGSKALILPDLWCARKDKRPVWVEVKTYGETPTFRAHGFKTHGIKKSHFDDYLKVSGITGQPVFLAVVELESMRLLMANLKKLEAYRCQCKVCRALGKTDSKCEVYFNRDQFHGLGTFTNSQIEAAMWLAEKQIKGGTQ
jgi:uncharacterized OB-fold protein